MAKLSVNVNKIALLRNSRGKAIPDLLGLTRKIIGYGAEGITIHPRADRRHITPDDARQLRSFVTDVELNFEGDIREEFLDLTLSLRPTQCTLVPVSYGEISSNRGWDIGRWQFLLAPAIQHIKAAGVRVSLFIEAHPAMARKAAEIGADRIEIFTEPYADAFLTGSYEHELNAIRETAAEAVMCGVGVNAGHDLTVANLQPLVREIPHIHEVSIGHALIARALEVGLEKAVREYLAAAHGGSVSVTE